MQLITDVTLKTHAGLKKKMLGYKSEVGNVKEEK